MTMSALPTVAFWLIVLGLLAFLGNWVAHRMMG